MEVNVNSEEFWRKKIEDVPVDQVCFKAEKYEMEDLMMVLQLIAICDY